MGFVGFCFFLGYVVKFCYDISFQVGLGTSVAHSKLENTFST